MSAEWVREMERDVRRFGGELPVDAFLPELESGHLEAGTNLAPRVATTPAENAGMPTAEPEQDPAAPPAARPEPGAEDLDAEILEFMNRDRQGPSRRTERTDDTEDDDDFFEFLSQSIDPNVD